jgi:Ca2+-binding RTX toxin-like protein
MADEENVSLGSELLNIISIAQNGDAKIDYTQLQQLFGLQELGTNNLDQIVEVIGAKDYLDNHDNPLPTGIPGIDSGNQYQALGWSVTRFVAYKTIAENLNMDQFELTAAGQQAITLNLFSSFQSFEYFTMLEYISEKPLFSELYGNFKGSLSNAEAFALAVETVVAEEGLPISDSTPPTPEDLVALGIMDPELLALSEVVDDENVDSLTNDHFFGSGPSEEEQAFLDQTFSDQFGIAFSEVPEDVTLTFGTESFTGTPSISTQNVEADMDTFATLTAEHAAEVEAETAAAAAVAAAIAATVEEAIAAAQAAVESAQAAQAAAEEAAVAADSEAAANAAADAANAVSDALAAVDAAVTATENLDPGAQQAASTAAGLAAIAAAEAQVAAELAADDAIANEAAQDLAAFNTAQAFLDAESAMDSAEQAAISDPATNSMTFAEAIQSFGSGATGGYNGVDGVSGATGQDSSIGTGVGFDGGAVGSVGDNQGYDPTDPAVLSSLQDALKSPNDPSGEDSGNTGADAGTGTADNGFDAGMDGGGSIKPILLDLDGDGVELISLDDSNAFFDINGDGYLDHMGWVGANDGLLAFDQDGDGVIDQRSEIVFSDYVAGAQSDLEGLAFFDSNGDEVLNASDELWSSFGVWQDLNGDGVTDTAEFLSLDARGISAVNLTSDGVSYHQDGSTVVGTGSYELTDGTSLDFADTILEQDIAWASWTYVGELWQDSLYAEDSVDIALNDLEGLENVIGSNFDDVVSGTVAGNILFGAAGDDEIFGLSGNDVLGGGAGTDFVLGGGGDDTYILSRGSGAEYIRDFDTDIEIESSQFVVGYIGDDPFYGTTTELTFDLIDAGDDTLELGSDIILDDIILELRGDDLVVGVGGGIDQAGLLDDVVDWAYITDWANAFTRVETLRLADETEIDLGGITIGSSTSDTYVGDGLANTYWGNAGDDNLSGGGGDDVLVGGDGMDVLDGGDGADRLWGGYGDDQLSGGLDEDHLIGGYGNDVLEGNEGDDILEATAGLNALSGGDGNDTIFGGFEFDYLAGDAGDDALYAGMGDDVVFGGEGRDAVSGGFGNDLLFGDDGDDFVDGEYGNDLLSGGAGDDILVGGTGNDVIQGGSGADNIEGGTGNDTLVYDSSLTNVSVNLLTGTATGGDAEGDTFSGIENLVGSYFFDTLTGDDVDNILFGSEGNDTLDGSAGTDAAGFAGNLADYTITGDATSATVTDNNIADGDEGTDTLTSIEQLQFADQSVFIDGTNNAAFNSAPVAWMASDDVVLVITEAELLANATDFEGDALSVSNVTADGGTLTDNGDGSWTFTPVADVLGLVNLSYDISDGTALTAATATIDVVEVNDAPDNTPPVALAATEDTAITFTTAQLLANASDADGDALSVSGLSVDGGAGTLTDNLDGTWTYNPPADFNGTVSLSFDISDGIAVTPTSATLEFAAVDDLLVNTAPVALSASDDVTRLITTAELLANVSDIDGDPLSISGLSADAGTLTDNLDGTWSFQSPVDFLGTVNLTYDISDGTTPVSVTGTLGVAEINDAPTVTAGINLSGTEDIVITITLAQLLANASDVDGDSLVVSGITIVGGIGTLSDNLDDTWTYDPPADFHGPLVLDYLVSDGSLSVSTSATIDFAAVNDAPTNTPPVALAGAEDVSRLITQADLLSNAVDVDGDALTATNLAVDVGTLVDNLDGTWTYDGPADFNGTVNLSYDISDGALTTPVSGTLVMDAVNDAPDSSPSVALSGTEDVSLVITEAELLANATDIDGDALSVANVTADGGTITDNLDGTWTYLGAANFNGTANLTYDVSDGLAATSVTATVDLTAVNDAPLNATPVSLSGTEDTALTITLAQLLANASDLEGDTLSVSNVVSDTVTLTDNLDGTWTYDPPADFNGTVTLSYDISDGSLTTSVSATIDLAAVDDILVTSGSDNFNATEDVSLTITSAEMLSSFSDVDNDVLTISNVSVDTGTLVDNLDGTWTYDAPANFNGLASLSYDVSDGTTILSSTDSITVAAVNDAPDSSPAVTLSGTEDISITITEAELLANASDVEGDAMSVANVTVDGGVGALTDNLDGTWTYDPPADFNGPVILNYDISDGALSTAVTASIDFAAVNDAPTNSPPVTLSGAEDVSRLITQAELLNNAVDIDGDALTATNLGVDVGTLVDNLDGTWTYDSPGNFNGTVNLSYDISDGALTTEVSGTLVMDAVNDAPDSTPAVTLSGTEDVSRLITQTELLANASDLEGDVLTAFNLSADIGTLTDNGDGTWTLDTPADFNGTVNLGYDISDGLLTTAVTGTVDFAAVNDAAVVGTPVALTGTEDIALLITTSELVADATDVDGDTLSVVNITVDTGTLTDNLDGTWTYNAPADFNGPASLSYDVFDGTATVATTASVDLAAVNDAPDANAGVIMLPEGGFVTGSVGATDVDDDVADLTFVDASTDGTLAAAAHGTVTFNADGTYSYQADAGYFGTDSFDVRVTDAAGLSDVVTVDVTAYSPTSSMTGGIEAQVNTYSTGSQIDSNISVNADGSYVIVWTSVGQDGSYDGIFGQRFDTVGVKAGSEFQVNTTTTLRQNGGSVVSLSGGGFVVSWNDQNGDGSGEGITAQLFDAAGVKIGGEISVNTITNLNQTTQQISALSDGGFVITWADSSGDGDGDGYGVRGQRFDSGGTKTGSEFGVNSYATSNQINGGLASFNTGGFVSTWYSSLQDGDGNGVFAQRFDTNGNKVGGELAVNTYTTGSQYSPQVAVLSDDGFVVVWHSIGQDGSGNGVFAQRFDASGAMAGSEFQVNSWTSGNQNQISVTELQDGGFVIAWTDNGGQDGGGKGSYGRRYDSTGATVGDEFRINETTAGAQYQPSIALRPDGNLVTAWNADDGEGVGIHSRIFTVTTGMTDLTGTVDADSLFGSDQDNVISGDAGDDTLSGGAGDDTLDGGAGNDTAVYTGNVADYAISGDDASATVTDQNATDGDEGSDILSGVEQLRFADRTLYLDGTNNAAFSSAAVTLSGTEDTSRLITQAELLADASDFEGDALTALNLSADIGTLTDNGDGTWTYDPPTDFNGSVNLGYDISDGSLTTEVTGTVDVAAVNDAAVVGTPVALTGTEDVGLLITTSELVANATDVDGDTLSVVNITVDTGSLTDNLNGTWTYTGPADFNGPASLSYDVFDGTATVATTASVDLAAVNDAPDANAGVIMLPEGGFATGSVGATDVDDDVADLTFADASTDGTLASAAHGTVTFNADGTYSYQADAGYVGTDSFDVRVTDAGGLSDVVTVDVEAFAAESLMTGGAETQVNTYTAGQQKGSTTAVAADGSYVVVWMSADQDGDGDGIYGQRYDAQSTKTGSEFLINTSTTNSQSWADITTLSGGGFAVTWGSKNGDGDNGGIKAQVFDAAMTKVGGELDVNTITYQNQYAQFITGLADGGFVVTWSDGSGTGDGDGAGVRAQRFDAAGTKVGSEFGINTYSTSAQGNTAVAAFNGGGFVSTWYSNGQDGNGYGSYAQIIDANGNKSGAEIAVNTYTTGDQEPPKVAVLSDDSFVVTWRSAGQDGSGTGIYAQRFGSDGAKLGVEFVVPTSTGGNQDHPSITAHPDGGFIVSWTDKASLDGNADGIFARRYDVNGNTVGDEFQINETTSGEQNNAVIEARPDGGLVATWLVFDSNSYGVNTRTFTSIDGVSDLTGTVDADSLFGSDQDNVISGDAGDDTLSGGARDDTLDGGAGNDTAVYAGNVADYAISGDDASATVTDQNASDGDEGSDSLSGIEQLRFADRTLYLDGTNNAAFSSTAVTLSGTEDTSRLITQAELLANASDFEGDALTALNLSADIGTLTDNLDGTWTYDPPADFNGTVNLGYDISDGSLTTAVTGTVDVDAVNDAPINSTPVSLAGAEDASLTITEAELLANASDVDGDSLSLSNLTVSTGTLTDNLDGTWTYDPPTDLNGTVTLSYDISDGTASVATTATVELAAVNDAPVSSSSVTLSGSEDTSRLITQDELLASASDIDGDVLAAVNLVADIGTLTDNGDGTWTLETPVDFNGTVNLGYDISDGSLATAVTGTIDVVAENDTPVNSAPISLAGTEDTSLTITEAELLANASDVEGDSLSLSNLTVSTGTLTDNLDGTWTYDPPADLNGTVTLSYDISDGTASVATTATVELAAVNDAAVNAAPVTLMASDDIARLITTADLIANASDIDGDTLSVTNLNVDAGTLTDNLDGTWTYVPIASVLGTVNLTYDISDGTDTIAATGTIDVVEVNDAPINLSPASLVGVEDTNLTITEVALLENAFDHDGDVLSVSNLKVVGGVGLLTDNLDGTWNFEPPADFNGIAYVLYDISDGTNLVKTISTIDFTAVNDLPTTAPVSDYASVEDSSLTITSVELLANADDVDGDALLVTNLVVEGGVGTLTDNLDGTWTYDPPADFNGTVHLSYDVSDGTASTPTTITIEIAATNDAPDTGLPVILTGSEDSSLTITSAELLVNSTDVEGDALSIGNLSVDGGVGVLTDNLDGTWTYDAPADFNGVVNFNFDVSDGTAASPASAVLNVAAINDATIISAPVTLTGTEDVSMLITSAELLTNASDVDGDSLTIQNLSVDGGIGVLTDNLDGTWTFDAPSNFNGVVNLSYDISDGTTSTATTGTVDVAAVNDAPSNGSTVSFNGAEDISILISAAALLTYASDVEGDGLSVVNLGVNGGVGSLSDNGNGTWTYSPPANFNGAVTLSYDISDGTTITATTATVNVAAVNDAPTHSGTPSFSGSEDSSVLITSSALLANASDVDGNSLSVSSISVNGGVGSLSDNGNGTWTYNPPLNFNGSVNLSYNISDGTTTIGATASVSISAVNDAPTTGTVSLSGTEDSNRLITSSELLANASDVEGQSLSVSGLSIASGSGSLTDHGNGTWTWNAPLNYNGNVSLSYTVSDGSASTGGSANLNVAPVNDAPDRTMRLTNSLSYGASVTYTMAQLLAVVVDPDGDAVTITSIVNHGAGTMSWGGGSSSMTYDSSGASGRTITIEYFFSDGQITNNGFLDIAVGVDPNPPGGKPIILDLDGDGVELVSVEDSTAFFDINDDGYREHMGWVAPDDGLLAYDHDGDGIIDKRSEIAFVDYVAGAQTDLEGLRFFDTNLDGVLDANDAEWSSFGVWQDADGDGETDAGEFTTIEDSGISSINLTSDGVMYVDGGNHVFGTGIYENADGSVGEFADVGLDYSDFAIVDAGTKTVRLNDGRIIRLPMDDSDITLDLGAETLDGAVGGAGNDTISAGTAQDVTILGGAGDDDLTGGTGDDRLRGGDGADTLDGGDGADVMYGGADNDVMSGGDGADVLWGNIGHDSITGGDGDDALIGGYGYDTLVGGIGADRLWGGQGNDNLYGGLGADQLKGGDGDDLLSGGYGVDILIGGDGTDSLEGGAGNDYLYGGTGDDILQGDGGDDTYIFARGDGSDTLNNIGSDASSTDRLKFGADISVAQLWFRQIGDDLNIDIVGEDGDVTISDWYSDTSIRLDQIEVASGEVLNQSDVQQLVNAMAAFSAPTGSSSDLSQATLDDLQSTLATVWAAA